MPPGVRPPDEDGFHVREASINPPDRDMLVLRVKGAAHYTGGRNMMEMTQKQVLVRSLLLKREIVKVLLGDMRDEFRLLHELEGEAPPQHN